MLSVGTVHFEDRFALAKKGRIGGGGQDSAWGAVHMAAALAGCRIALNAMQVNKPVLSVGATCFDDKFCASKKGGIGGGGVLCTWQLPTASLALPTVTHHCNVTTYVENRNNYERNGSELEDVLCIRYYISSCKTATNFW